MTYLDVLTHTSFLEQIKQIENYWAYYSHIAHVLYGP